jgi:hypothetical protein
VNKKLVVSYLFKVEKRYFTAHFSTVLQRRVVEPRPSDVLQKRKSLKVLICHSLLAAKTVASQICQAALGKSSMPCRILEVELTRIALEYTLGLQILLYREMSKPHSGVWGQVFTMEHGTALLRTSSRDIASEGSSVGVIFCTVRLAFLECDQSEEDVQCAAQAAALARIYTAFFVQVNDRSIDEFS